MVLMPLPFHAVPRGSSCCEMGCPGMGDAPGHLAAGCATQPGSSSVPGISCWVLHWAVSAGELVSCGDRGAAWHGPAGAILPLLWSPEPLVAASCRNCRSSSSLSSPNSAGFVSPDQKVLTGWRPALLGQFLLAGSVLPTREIIFLSQEVQAEALQSLGGDGS